MNHRWLVWTWWVCSPLAWAQQSAADQEVPWSPSNNSPIAGSPRIHQPATLPAPSPEGVQPIWSIEIKDVTLSNTLLRWSQQERWQMVWEADRDFPILATVYLKGSFQSVILSVMESLAQTDYPLQAIMHPNSKVVRIVRHMQAPSS